MTSKRTDGAREKLSASIFRSYWMKAISVLAGLVVFTVTYALILPAITMSSQESFCGYEEHEHTAECYNAEGELICELEEHVHTLECYSDMYADIENEEIWIAELPELTGDRNEDVVAIAQSLINYRESDKNYLVSEDNQTQGYSRFGHWYGDMIDRVLSETGEGQVERFANGLPVHSYENWDAMFVSYVLNYAQISDFGADDNAGNWAGALAASGKYVDAADYVPVAGDLIFFTPYAGADLQVGIVSSVNMSMFGFGNEIQSISVILGNSDNSVAEINVAIDEYNEGDVIFESIWGYGVLTPKEPEAEEPEAENPEAEDPEVENPEAENPEVEAPETENQDVEEPEADVPEAEDPGAEDPGAENPEVEAPETETPEVEDPETDVPEVEVPEDTSRTDNMVDDLDGLTDPETLKGETVADEAAAVNEDSEVPAEQKQMADGTDISIAQDTSALSDESGANEADATEAMPTDESATADEVTVSADESTVAAGKKEELKTNESTVANSREQETYNAGSLTAYGNDYIVTLSYGTDAKIPPVAKLKIVEIKQGTDEYDSYINDAKTTLGINDDYTVDLTGRFFDIKIIGKNGEIEPQAPVKVEINYKKVIDEGTSENINAIHFGKDSVEKLDVATQNADGCIKDVSFTAESFSVYGVVYTVDFAYHGYVYNLGGEHQISLSDLMQILEFDRSVKDVSDVSVRLTEQHDETVDDSEFYIEQAENDWMIKSDVPFGNVYTLIITMKDKAVYIVDVTDDNVAMTTDLNLLLTDVSIEDDKGESVIEDGNTIIVTDEESYTFSFVFEENTDYQFANSQSMYYTVPDGVEPTVGTSGTFDIKIGTRVITGNTYEVVDDNGVTKIKVDFNRTHRNYRFLQNSTDVSFHLDFTGTISESTTVLNFGGDGETGYAVEHQSKHNASVEKNGYYDASDKKMHYKVIIHSTDGDSENINVRDAISGTALTFDSITGVYVSDQNGNSLGTNSSYTLNSSGENGFDLTIAKVEEDQYVTVEYTAAVDFTGISESGNATVSETGNSVDISVPGDDDTTDNSDIHEEKGIEFSSISKLSTATSDVVDEDGNTPAEDYTGKKYRIVTWKVTANTEGLVSLNGGTITDTLLDNKDYVDYYGDGITVTKISGGTSTDSVIPWSSVGVSDKNSATGWSYSVTDEGNYAYEIIYQTRVEITNLSADQTLQVSNAVEDKYGEDIGKVTVQPDVVIEPEEVVPEITKNATSVTAETTTWKISVNIPAGWSGPLVIEDTLPTRGGYYDTVQSVQVEGYTENVDYSLTVTDAIKQTSYGNNPTYEVIGDKSFTISFLNGIEASSENRTINIVVVTKNNEEWVNTSSESIENQWLNNHINSAKALGDGVEYSADEDIVQPKPVSVKKKSLDDPYAVDYYENGVKTGTGYLFPFQVTFTGITTDSIDFIDEFNTDIFEVYEGLDFLDNYNSYTDRLAAYYNDNENNLGTKFGYATVTPLTTGDVKGATFHLENLPKTSGNAYYSFYHLKYYLMVTPDKVDDLKDYVAKNGSVVEVNGNITGKSYAFENTAIWNNVSSTAEYSYTVNNLLNKTSEYDSASDVYHYTITLNPENVKLNEGVNFDLTDVFSGVTVDSSTITLNATASNGNSVLCEVYDSEEAAAADTEFEGIVVIYDSNTNIITFAEIPDQTSVVIRYDGKPTHVGTVNTETKKLVEEATNSADALDYHYEVSTKHEHDFIAKSKSEIDSNGNITFTIDLNPDKIQLKGGNDYTLTDTYTGNLIIDNDSFTVTVCDPDEENTKSAAILSSKKINGNTYSFTIPDATHVTITYTGKPAYQVDSSGNITASYSNTAEAEDVPDIVTDEFEKKMLEKTSDEMIGLEGIDGEGTGYGYIPFTIDFNPLAMTLLEGEDIKLTDTFNNLLVDYSSVVISPAVYPEGHEKAGEKIVWDYSNNVGTFWVPDSTHVVITYRARPDYSKGTTVEWSNTAEAKGYIETEEGVSEQSSSGEGEGSVGNQVWLYKYEAGHMERPINGVTFNLFYDNNGTMEPVLDTTTNQQITFTTENDIEKGDGYVLVALNESQGYPMGLEQDQIYYLVEVPDENTADYYDNTTVYNFVIHPDFVMDENDKLVPNEPYVKPDYMTGTRIYIFGKDDIVKIYNDKITTDVTAAKYWVNDDGTFKWPSDIASVTLKLQQKIGDGEFRDISAENNNIPSYYWNSTLGTIVEGADGTAWSDTIDLTSDSSQAVWSNLDFETEDQTPISYQIVEVKVTGTNGAEAVPDENNQVTINGRTYDVMGGTVKNGKTYITNAERRNIEFEKKWENVPSTITWNIPDSVTWLTLTSDSENYNTVNITSGTIDKTELYINQSPASNQESVDIDLSKLRVVVQLKRYAYRGGDKVEVPFDLTDRHEARLAGAKILYGEANESWGSPESGHWTDEFVETGFWTGEWKDLPTAGLDANGNEIDYIYEIEEVAVTTSREVLNDSANHYIDIKEIFTTSISSDGLTITNKLREDDNYYLNVEKVWQDAGGEEISGDPVEFQLIRKGTVTEATAGGETINGGIVLKNSWSHALYDTNDSEKSYAGVSFETTSDKKMVITVTCNDTLLTAPDLVVKEWNGYPSNYNWTGDEITTISPTISGNVAVYELPMIYGSRIIIESYAFDASKQWTASVTYEDVATTTVTDGEVIKPINDADYFEGYEVDSTGEYKFTLTPGETVSFPNLPYSVAISDSESGVYTYSINEITTGDFTTVVTYGDGSKEYYDAAPADESTEPLTELVTITNKQTKYYENSSAAFTINKEKKGEPENSKLSGVTFALTDSSDVVITSGVTDSEGALNMVIPGDSLGSHNGADDTTTTKTFILTENVPDGFLPVDGNPWTVTVTANGVTETTENGITTVTYNWEVTGVGELTGNSGVYTIVNEEMTKGALKLTKTVTVDGSPISDTTKTTPADGTYTFTIEGTDSGSTASKTVEIVIEKGVISEAKVDNVSVELTSGYVVISDLEAGQYTVRESVPTNGTAISMINGEESTNYSTVVTVVAGDTAGAQASVIFTNDYSHTSASVTKIWKNTTGENVTWDSDEVENIKLQLTRKKGTDVDATFETFLLTVTDSQVTGIPTEWEGVSGTVAGNAEDGYLVTLTGLPKNYYSTADNSILAYNYYFSEKKVDGYLEPSYKTSGGNPISDATEVVSGGYVVNTPEEAVVLPSTGGPGTKTIYILGLTLTTIAACGFVFVRRFKIGLGK